MKGVLENWWGFSRNKHLYACDYDELYQEHVDLKVKLRAYLLGLTDISFSLESLRDANTCKLSQWVNQATPQYGDDRQFHDLKLLHEQFHLLTAQIFIKHARGQTDEALHLIDGPECTQYLQELKDTLEQLKSRIQS